MILYVKNMLSERCRLYLETQLREVGLRFLILQQGIIAIADGWTQEQREELATRLTEGGMEIMIHRKSSIVDKIESAIKEMIDDMSEVPKGNYSEYLSKKLDTDYATLSKIFSETKGSTIQQYIIQTKVEKIIDFLADETMSLTDISYKLQYSSVAHLSNQFRKIMKCSPSEYRKSGN